MMLSIVDLKNPWGRPVWHCPETTSTMVETRHLAEGANNQPQDLAGTIVLADWQSAGQGRFADRRWEAKPGASLLFTIMLEPRPGLALSMVLAAGICQWLDSMGLGPKVKWPNDILIGEKKLAGILVQGNQKLMHCGIGINLKPAEYVPTNGKRPAASLSENGIDKDNREALIELLPFLYDANQAVAGNLHNYLERRLYRLGQSLSVDTGLPGTAIINGIVKGLSAQGGLVMETAAGLQTLVSGE